MKLEQKIITIFFVSLGLCGTLLVALLGYQYLAVRREVDELISLKSEYQSYIVALKQITVETESENTEQTLQKKKSSRRAFNVVNRDPEYLRKHALTLAQQHNLTAAIQKLYTSSAPKIDRGPVRNRQLRARTAARRRSTTRHDYTAHSAHIDRSALSLIWPISAGNFWISTGFGPRRHPRGHWEFHQAIDMASPRGTPIYAAASGVVLQAQYAGGYGNTIVISHDAHHKTRYAHLSKILVSVGDYVTQGSRIGKVGSTGNVRGKNGSHLHFEVLVCDKRVNPLYFLP